MGFSEECGRLRKASDAVHTDCAILVMLTDIQTVAAWLTGSMKGKESVKNWATDSQGILCLKKSRYIMSESYGL